MSHYKLDIMKKLLVILFVFITSFGFSQNYYTDIERNKATFDTIHNNYHFLWRGDTIWFDEHAAVQFSEDTVTWHSQQTVDDKFFQLKAINETYYRQMKIWDGRTLDLDTFNIINVDTAVNELDAVNYVLLKDSIAAIRALSGASDLDFAGDTGTGAVDLDSQTFTLSGTALEVETSASGQTITIGLTSNITDTLAAHNTRINLRKLNSDSTDNTGYVSNWAFKDTLNNYWSYQEITVVDTTRWGTHTTSIHADSVIMDTLGGPTYWSLQDFKNTSGGSVGHVTGGAISDAGSQTYNVALGTGEIKSTDSQVGDLFSFDWAASNGNAIADGETKWVFIDYSSGSPEVNIKSTFSSNIHTEFYLGNVVREGTTLHILNNPDCITNPTAHSLERLRHFNFQRVEGLILGETADRYITVTAGETYNKNNEFILAAFNSSTGGTFDTYIDAIQQASGQTQWDSINYNNGGSLTALTTNRYGVHWFYQEADGALVYLYGTSNTVSISGAQAEGRPSTLPPRISAGGYIIGRGIFQKGDGDYSLIETVFETTFTSTTPENHDDMANINLAQSGILYGHINDQTQTIAGLKLLTNSGQILNGSDTAINANEVFDYFGQVNSDLLPSTDLTWDIGSLTKRWDSINGGLLTVGQIITDTIINQYGIGGLYGDLTPNYIPIAIDTNLLGDSYLRQVAGNISEYTYTSGLFSYQFDYTTGGAIGDYNSWLFGNNSVYTYVGSRWDDITDWYFTFKVGGVEHGPYRYSWGAAATGSTYINDGVFNTNAQGISTTHTFQPSIVDADAGNHYALFLTFNIATDSIFVASATGSTENTVYVNGNLYPEITDSLNLGSPTFRWKTINGEEINVGGSPVIGGTVGENQIAFGSDADTLEGDANFTWDGSTVNLNGDLSFPIGGKVIFDSDAGSDTYITAINNILRMWSGSTQSLELKASEANFPADGNFGGNIKIGAGAAGVDYTITVDGETDDGVITYDEDNDLFSVDNDLNVTETLTYHEVDLTAALAADSTYVGTTETANVGETVGFGDLLYFNFTDKEWKKADADAEATTPVQRMALATATDGNPCVMLIEGFVRKDDWNFTAAPTYLSEGTAGVPTSTRPSATGEQIQRIGIAYHADKLHFRPSIDVATKQ